MATKTKDTPTASRADLVDAALAAAVAPTELVLVPTGGRDPFCVKKLLSKNSVDWKTYATEEQLQQLAAIDDEMIELNQRGSEVTLQKARSQYSAMVASQAERDPAKRLPVESRESIAERFSIVKNQLRKRRHQLERAVDSICRPLALNLIDRARSLIEDVRKRELEDAAELVDGAPITPLADQLTATAAHHEARFRQAAASCGRPSSRLQFLVDAGTVEADLAAVAKTLN